jgi:hypothetical protein
MDFPYTCSFRPMDMAFLVNFGLPSFLILNTRQLEGVIFEVLPGERSLLRDTRPSASTYCSNFLPKLGGTGGYWTLQQPYMVQNAKAENEAPDVCLTQSHCSSGGI